MILEPSFVSFSGCKNQKTSTIPAKTYQAKTVQLFCVLSKQVAGTGCPRAKAIMAISLKTMAAAGLAQTGNEELIVYRGFVWKQNKAVIVVSMVCFYCCCCCCLHPCCCLTESWQTAKPVVRLILYKSAAMQDHLTGSNLAKLWHQILVQPKTAKHHYLEHRTSWRAFTQDTTLRPKKCICCGKGMFSRYHLAQANASWSWWVRKKMDNLLAVHCDLPGLLWDQKGVTIPSAHNSVQPIVCIVCPFLIKFRNLCTSKSWSWAFNQTSLPKTQDCLDSFPLDRIRRWYGTFFTNAMPW